MSLLPFSPLGVQNKLDELYSLADADLNAEAGQIKANFKKWIKANFELTAQQHQYLMEMNYYVTTYYGQQCSLSFLHRLDIILVYPDPPETSGYTKWINSSSTIKAQTNGSGETVVTGTLTFSVSYQ